jgi:phage tail-like protein
MMAVGDRIDPYRSYTYRVELDNTPVAGFSEASNLTFDVEPVEYREGTDPLYPRKLSGMRKFSDITLKKGYTQDDDLYVWYATALNGPVERRNGSIILQDEQQVDQIRWNFNEGWISKYERSALNASSNEVLIESVQICVERIEVEFLNP